MSPKRLEYAAGDDLQLYATPEESIREGKRLLEEERQRKHRQHMQQHQKHQGRHRHTSGHHHVDRHDGDGHNSDHHSSMDSHSSIDSDLRRRGTPPITSSSGTQNPSTTSISLSASQSQVPIRNQHNYVPSHGESPRRHPVSLNRVIPPSMATSSTPPMTSTAGLQTTPPIPNKSVGTDSRTSDDMMETKNIQIATQLFYNHDIKQKGRLTAEELRNLLQNDDCSHFCISAVDALINLFGATRFGTINQAEFVSLYKRIKYWRKVYVDNDINGSYTISVMEYHNSLQELGYLIPFEVAGHIFDQYAEFINTAVNGKELKFDRFVESLVWLMRLTKFFRNFDANQEGIATIHYKDFINIVLYLGQFLPSRH